MRIEGDSDEVDRKNREAEAPAGCTGVVMK